MDAPEENIEARLLREARRYRIAQVSQQLARMRSARKILEELRNQRDYHLGAVPIPESPNHDGSGRKKSHRKKSHR